MIEKSRGQSAEGKGQPLTFCALAALQERL
jgi:hypothetical protein